MTTCVAALCDARKTIVLVADRLVGYGFVQSEPEIAKRLELHNNWHVLMAGNDIDPVFDIVDAAKEKLAATPAPSVTTVMTELFQAYKDRRLASAEAQYISPRGITWDSFFKEGRKWAPETDYLERLAKVDAYDLDLQLLVAGFDDQKVGHIFSIENDYNRGEPRRHDLGFHAIGSGYVNATFFLAYRQLGPDIGAREAVLYALEAKYWGEEAPGVGEDTDIRIIRGDQDDIIIGLDRIEERLIPICQALRPRQLHAYAKHLKTLNELEELKEFDPITPKKKAKAKEAQHETPSDSKDSGAA